MCAEFKFAATHEQVAAADVGGLLDGQSVTDHDLGQLLTRIVRYVLVFVTVRHQESVHGLDSSPYPGVVVGGAEKLAGIVAIVWGTRNWIAWYALAAIASCGAILCSLAMPSLVRAEGCVPSFPYQGGWLGGDGAFSIPLSNERELWLFGDTFVSADPEQTQSRAGAAMVRNSIAISSCRGGKWTIEYHWRRRLDGHNPHAVFESGTDAFYYWPLDGFVYGKTLYVALLRMAITRPAGPFAFRLLGVDLAEIAHSDKEPRDWHITYFDLSESEAAFPGVSIVVRPPYVWLFGVMNDSVILTRISLDRLDRPAESLQYLAAGSKWKAAPIRGDAEELVAQGQSDFSVRYHSEIGKWVLVQQQPGYRSGQIGIRTSTQLEGPWSPFHWLMDEPEMHSRRTRRERIICYAAKEHPSFESVQGTLVVTYTCNSLNFRKLKADMSIYRPIVTQLPMH